MKKVDLVRQLALPLLRYCLRNHVAMSEIVEVLKDSFVTLAQDQLEKNGESPNNSRISIMTGLTRREVQRCREGREPQRSQGNLLARILGQWEQDSRFRTAAGDPRVLTCSGARNEFRSLVESISKDVKPASLLSELERIGAVERKNGRILLLSRMSSYTKDPDKIYDLLIRNTESLVRAAEENMTLANDPKNLHVRTEFDNIFQQDLPTIRAWLLEHGYAFHKEARDFLARYDKDITYQPEREGGGRVVLGAFSWTAGELK